MTYPIAVAVSVPSTPTSQSSAGDSSRSKLGLSTAVRSMGMLLAVGMLFSAAAYWGWAQGRLPAPPLAWMVIVFAVAALGVLLDVSRIGSGGLWAWAIANAAIAMASFLWSSGSDVALQEVRNRVLSSLQLIAYVVLLADGRVRRLTRVAIVLSTLGAIVLNLWEVTHPMAFSMSLGRSAGFYVNPNIAGAALIAGMVLGLPAVPARLRELFMLGVAVGVFTTLSRGALLCWVIVVAWLVVSRAVRGKRLAITFASGAALALSIGGAMIASGQLGYIGGGAERFVRQRLGIGNSAELGADVSASSRSKLALHAADMFGERPLVGHGAGSTVEWSEPESTHNVYVRQLAEYGLVGAWLAPLLLFISWRAARSIERDQSSASAMDDDAGDAQIRRATATAFVIFLALWGLFSHNVLDDPFMLIGLGLIATLSSREVMRGQGDVPLATEAST